MGQRSREAALRVLGSELMAAPSPRTLHLLRALVDAVRADYPSGMGHGAYLDCEGVWAYVRPCPGKTDRELGMALVAPGGSMHLVRRHAAGLVAWVLGQPVGG